MKISEGIDGYIRNKNASGVEFATGKRYLIGLSRRLGEIELDRVKADQVLAFLDESIGQVETWRMKYYVLIRFFDFWAARGEISYVLFPPPKPRVRQKFVPYVYSRTELRALLRVKEWQFKTTIDPITMRTFLLFLYGTGAMVGEALGLSIEDIDLRKRQIMIRNRSIIRSRQIPISDELCAILRRYLAWRFKRHFQDSHLFVNKDGRPATYDLFERCFRKLREIANISREKSATYQPRLHDFKFTFAVHRITSWIRSNTDLNRMLPALAAYMGLKLVSTERYFHLTPERFKKHLNKLSPQGHKNHWRNNKELMAFLTNL